MEYTDNEAFELKEYNLIMHALKDNPIKCDKCSSFKWYAPHHGFSSQSGIYLIECMKCNTRLTREILDVLVEGYELPDLAEPEATLAVLKGSDPKAFKTDSGKIKAGVLGEFKRALMEVARVGTMGIDFKGYARGSWKDVPDAKERYYDAFWRHILAIEVLNPEDKDVYHIAQVIWNGLVILEFMLEDKDADTQAL